MSKFILGNIVMTKYIADKCKNDLTFAAFVDKALQMHREGNWGDICDEDWEANQKALKNGDERILSAYILSEITNEKIWIITEWDRSVTTILYPWEY